MIYIYDQIVGRDQDEFTYLDIRYPQTGRTRMGKMEYYTYSKPGTEPILVIPTFAKQFLEAARKFWKIREVTTNTAALMRIEDAFGEEPQVAMYDDSVEVIYHYAVNYKNIRITMRLQADHFLLEPDFTIVSENIFGNYLTVDVRENEELYKYCEE
jgi:hypothetical protein